MSRTFTPLPQPLPSFTLDEAQTMASTPPAAAPADELPFRPLPEQLTEDLPSFSLDEARASYVYTPEQFAAPNATQAAPTGVEQLQDALDYYRAQRPAAERHWTAKVKEYVPFGGALEAIDLGTLAAYAQRAHRNTASADEIAAVARWITEGETRHQEADERGVLATIGHTAVDVASIIPKYGVEFLLTGGAYTAGRKAAVGTGEAALKSALRVWLARGVGAAAQGVAMMPAAGSEFAAQRHLDAAITGDVESKLWHHAPAAYVDTFIEVAGERSGAHLMGWLGKFAQKIPGMRRAADWFAKQPAAVKVAELRAGLAKRIYSGITPATRAELEKIAASAGYQGIPEELAEERLGEFLRGITGDIADVTGMEGLRLAHDYGTLQAGRETTGALGSLALGDLDAAGESAARILPAAGAGVMQLAGEALAFALWPLAQGAAGNLLSRGGPGAPPGVPEDFAPDAPPGGPAPGWSPENETEFQQLKSKPFANTSDAERVRLLMLGLARAQANITPADNTTEEPPEEPRAIMGEATMIAHLLPAPQPRALPAPQPGAPSSAQPGVPEPPPATLPPDIRQRGLPGMEETAYDAERRERFRNPFLERLASLADDDLHWPAAHRDALELMRRRAFDVLKEHAEDTLEEQIDELIDRIDEALPPTERDFQNFHRHDILIDAATLALQLARGQGESAAPPAPEKATPTFQELQQAGQERLAQAVETIYQYVAKHIESLDYFKQKSHDQQRDELEALRRRTYPQAEKLLAAIDERNHRYLLNVLHPDNGGSRQVFQQVTGVKLPNTWKKTRAAIREWYGAEAFDAAEQLIRSEREQEEAARRAKEEAANRESALNDPVRIEPPFGQGGVVRSGTMKELIDEYLARGYDAEPGTRGVMPTFLISDATGQRSVTLRKKYHIEYAQQQLAARDAAAASGEEPTDESTIESAEEPTTNEEPGDESTSGSAGSSAVGGGTGSSGTAVAGGAGGAAQGSAEPGQAPRRPGGKSNSGGGRAAAAEPTPDDTGSEGEGEPVDRGDTEPEAGSGAAAPSESPSGPAEVPLDSRYVNFTIEPGTQLAPNGTVAKIQANIKAIRILRQLEADDRPATREEQEKLAQYTGWGALSQVFDHRYGKPMLENEAAYNRNASWEKKWGKYYRQLTEMLSEEEWLAARASTTNAHYTSPDVITPMWELAQHLGFRGGKVLEPGAGIGHFFGLMPGDLADQSKLIGVELDLLTGRILKALYPRADIFVQGFEDTKIPPGSIDLAISNVPFHQNGPADASARYGRKLNLHNYFLLRMLDAVKPGGLVMAITTHHSLDSNAADRALMGERADLVGAIRLPNDAFKKNAGTEVVTDILIFRKKSTNPFAEAQPFANLLSVGKDKKKEMLVNEYIATHPTMSLGKHALAGTMHAGEFEYTLEPIKGAVIETQMREAIAQLPSDVMGADAAAPFDFRQLGDAAGLQERSLVVRDGKAALVLDGQFVDPAELHPKLASEGGKAQAKRYATLRQHYDAHLAIMASDQTKESELELSRQKLNQFYDDYVAHHKALSTLSGNKFEEEAGYYRLLGLEIEKVTFKEGKKVRYFDKADVFRMRTVPVVSEPTSAATPADALRISLNFRGRLDIDYVATLLRTNSDTAAKKLADAGLAFLNPITGLWEDSTSYLAGNVRKKLLEARQAADDSRDERWQANIAALEQVQPAPRGIEKVNYRLGSAWLPPDVVQDFARVLLEAPKGEITYHEKLDGWVVRQSTFPANGANRSLYGVAKLDGSEILAKILNLRTIQVNKSEDYIDDNGKRRTKSVPDPVDTRTAQGHAQRMQDEFRKWVRNHPDQGQKIADAFNEKLNFFVDATWDGSHVELPGANPNIKLRPYQKSAVWRMVQQGYAMLAHAVGAGKTYTMIATAMELRRLGLARKPLIVVQNSTLKQFGASFNQFYPTAKVLVATSNDLQAKNRRKFMARIASGDFDSIVMAQSSFNLLPVDPKREEALMRQQLQELEEAIYEAAAEEGKDGPTVKELEGRLSTKRTQLDKLLAKARERADNTIFFEQLGIDAIFIDEAHAYKKPPFTTKLTKIKGLTTQTSVQAMQALLRLRHVQEKTGGRNTFLATGTPISNTLGEVWQMYSLFAPQVLEEFNVSTFDRFVSAYAQVVPVLTQDAGQNWVYRNTLAKFINGEQLSRFIRSGWDVLTSEDLRAYFTEEEEKGLPKLREGTPSTVAVPLSESVRAFNEFLKGIFNAYKALPGRERKELSHIPVLTYNAARAAALDIRLVYPDAKDDPGSKINTAARDVARIYHRTADTKSTQLVFSDQINRVNMEHLVNFAAGRVDAPDIAEEDEDADDETESNVSEFLYRDLAAKLVTQGVKREEIAIMQDYKTDAAKLDLFNRVKAGDVRIVIGGTASLGTGVNVQDKLIAIHHLDSPWLPMALQQREGRILRHGNENEIVDEFYYGMVDTLDAAIFGKLLQKAKIIEQALGGKLGEEFEDPFGEVVLTFQEQMAMLSGDPTLLERVALESQIRQLRLEAEGADNGAARFRDNLLNSKEERRRALAAVKENTDLAAAMAYLEAEGVQFTVEGAQLDRTEAGKAIDGLMQPRLAAVLKRVQTKELKQKNWGYDRSEDEDYHLLTVTSGKARIEIYAGVDTHSVTQEDGGMATEWESFPVAYLYYGHERLSDTSAKTGSGLLGALITRPEKLREYAARRQQDAEREEAYATDLAANPPLPFSKQAELDAAEERLRELTKSLVQEEDPHAEITDEEEEPDYYDGGEIPPDVMHDVMEDTRTKPRTKRPTKRRRRSKKQQRIRERPDFTPRPGYAPKTGDELRPIPMPELYQLAKALLGDNPPQIKNIAGSWGRFEYGNDFERVLVNPMAAGDETVLAMVLAHEVGHLVDYLPDKTLLRGNILGRIGSLVGYLEQYLAGEPGGPGPLTDAERARLEAEAVKLTSTTAQQMMEGEIISTLPITPADVLAIWNSVDTSHLPAELLDYVKRLDTAAKMSIVKEALKGQVAAELQKFARVVRGDPTMQTVEKKATLAEIKQKFQELLEAEIRKRHLLSTDVITQELKALTMWWKPFDVATRPPSYLKYRYSSHELYADALSVLINSPGDLAERAPQFYTGLLNYMERKPAFMREYLTLQALLESGSVKLAESRTENITAMFTSGDAAIRAAEQASRAARQSIGETVRQFLGQYVLDKTAPVKRRARLAENKAAEYTLDELFRADNANHVFLNALQRDVLTPLRAEGIHDADIGEYLFLHRVLNDRNELANPIGFVPSAAAEQIKALADRLGRDRYRLLLEKVARFHDLVFAIAERATDVGVYSQQLFKEVIKPNRHSYAAFAVVKYLEDHVPAEIQHQVGTFEEVANPLTATVLKIISMNRLIELQKAKNATRDLLRQSFSQEIKRVKLAFRQKRPSRRPKQGFEYLTIMEDGRPVWYEVPSEIAKTFQMHDIGQLARIGNLLQSAVYKIFHPLFVTFNPGFAVSNPFRDLRRTYKLLGALGSAKNRELQAELIKQGIEPAEAARQASRQNITLGQLLWAWLKSFPVSLRRARGIDDATIDEMMATKALDVPFVDVDGLIDEGKVDRLLSQYNLRKDAAAHEQQRGLVAKALRKVLDVVEAAGVVSETMTKVAGYELLKERGVAAQERAFQTRKYVGTPDYKQRGLATPLTNSLWMYSKVRWNGLQAELDIATNPRTAAGYWWRTVMTTLLPRTLMTAALLGLFGPYLQELFRRISRRFRDNYDVVPIGLVDDGGEEKTVFLSIPTDDVSRFMGAVWGRMLQTAFAAAGGDAPDGSATQAASATLGEAWGQLVPNFNPLLDLAAKWQQFATGVNPYDDFAGQSVVPDREWSAGGWYATRKMLAWSIDKFGVAGDVVQPFTGSYLGSSYDPGTDTTLETSVRSLPGVSRLLRVSNRGLSEEEWAGFENDERERERFRLSLPQHVRNLTSERYLFMRRGEQSGQDELRDKVLDLWYSRSYLPITQDLRDAEAAGYNNRAQQLREQLAQESTAIVDPKAPVPAMYLAAAVHEVTDAANEPRLRATVAWQLVQQQQVPYETARQMLYEEEERQARKRQGIDAKRPLVYSDNRLTSFGKRVQRLNRAYKQAELHDGAP